MRARDSKGRFTKKANSENSEKKPMKGKYKDNKGRWHGSNGKYV